MLEDSIQSLLISGQLLSSGDFKKSILDGKKGGIGVFQNFITNIKISEDDLAKEHLKRSYRK